MPRRSKSKVSKRKTTTKKTSSKSRTRKSATKSRSKDRKSQTPVKRSRSRSKFKISKKIAKKVPASKSRRRSAVKAKPSKREKTPVKKSKKVVPTMRSQSKVKRTRAKKSASKSKKPVSRRSASKSKKRVRKSVSKKSNNKKATQKKFLDFGELMETPTSNSFKKTTKTKRMHSKSLPRSSSKKSKAKKPRKVRNYFTVAEDSLILVFIKKNSEMKTTTISKAMASTLHRSSESVRDRIKRYLSKINEKDIRKIITTAKKNPSHHVHFVTDKSGGNRKTIKNISRLDPGLITGHHSSKKTKINLKKRTKVRSASSSRPRKQKFDHSEIIEISSLILNTSSFMNEITKTPELKYTSKNSRGRTTALINPSKKRKLPRKGRK